MSKCICFVDTPWQVIKAQRPLAARSHTCGECGARIEPGERYERVAGLYDDLWSHYKTCYRCLALRDWLEAVSCCFCWHYEGVLDDALEEIQEGNWRPGFKFAGYRLYITIRQARRARHD